MPYEQNNPLRRGRQWSRWLYRRGPSPRRQNRTNIVFELVMHYELTARGIGFMMARDETTAPQTTSDEQIAANRRNALKSTDPLIEGARKMRFLPNEPILSTFDDII